MIETYTRNRPQINKLADSRPKLISLLALVWEPLFATELQRFAMPSRISHMPVEIPQTHTFTTVPKFLRKGVMFGAGFIKSAFTEPAMNKQ